jgi:HSP20 family protein
MSNLPLRHRSESPFGSVFRELDRLMRDYDDNSFGVAASQTPAFELHQDADAFHVTAELPGFSEKDVKLDVHRGVVTVSGQRATATPEGFRATHRERAMVRFSRSLRLPEEVDEAQIKASLKDGVLSVSLPKRPEVKPRQIPIQAS